MNRAEVQHPSVRLVRPHRRYESRFLDAVRRSGDLHGVYATPPSTSALYRDFIRRSKQDRFECHLVLNDTSGDLVGVANINEIVRGMFESAYLGYYVFEPFSGKGFMKAALSSVIDRAFGELKLHRLEANIQPDNTGSIRLVETLGFRMEGFSPKYLKIAGEWRDHERWAILRDDWISSDKQRGET